MQGDTLHCRMTNSSLYIVNSFAFITDFSLLNLMLDQTARTKWCAGLREGGGEAVQEGVAVV